MSWIRRAWIAYAGLVEKHRPLVTRIELVVITLIVGLAMRAWSRVDEAGHGLRHLGLIGISLLLTWWPWMLIANVFFAAAWLGWIWRTRGHPQGLARTVGAALLFLNRQFDHVEALLAWVTVLVVAWANFSFQITAIAACIALGPHIMDRAAGKVSEDWIPQQRYALVTTAALVAMLAVGYADPLPLLPLLGTVFSGVMLRAAIWRHWGEQLESSFASAEAKAAAHRAAVLLDRPVIIVALLVTIGLPLWSVRGVVVADSRDHARRFRAVTDCGPSPSPTPADVAVFVMADTHFHELSGQMVEGQVSLIERIVSVAVRPIELDLLSGVLVRHFIDQYRALGDEVRWVHLGDAGDFGCPSELERFAALVKAQGLGGRLAGFALGNHDVYFTGNFRWSPEWKPACRERVTPDDARSKAIAQLEPLLDKASIHSEHKPYFASLALLGAKNGTEVIGIFADSTDPGHYDLGAAGIRGSVGRDQRRWILARIDEQQQLHPNVRFLLFMHHPYDALARDGRLFVDAVAEKLGERLLGMVSAHTHLAGYRCHEEKNGTLHELVVGSTLDPPSEAALIEVGGGDKPWVRMTTVPAIRRDGLECAPNPSPVPTADECRDLWLRKAAQCPNVFKWDAEAQPGEAEGSLGVLSQRSTLEMMRETRDRRAHDFLVCIGEPAGDGLLEDHERLKELQQRLDDRHGEKEILCAAWAASALKDYKARGWTFAQAVRWAFDGAAVVGALETRYTVGEACH